MTTNEKPSANVPRLPNEREVGQLKQHLERMSGDPSLAEAASIAVFDHYVTDSPNYAGKLMSVVWSGSPTFYEAFTWNDRGQLRAEECECKNSDVSYLLFALRLAAETIRTVQAHGTQNSRTDQEYELVLQILNRAIAKAHGNAS